MTTYGKALMTEEQFLEKSVLDGRALGVGNIRNSFNYERKTQQGCFLYVS